MSEIDVKNYSEYAKVFEVMEASLKDEYKKGNKPVTFQAILERMNRFLWFCDQYALKSQEMISNIQSAQRKPLPPEESGPGDASSSVLELS